MHTYFALGTAWQNKKPGLRFWGAMVSGSNQVGINTTGQVVGSWGPRCHDVGCSHPKGALCRILKEEPLIVSRWKVPSRSTFCSTFVLPTACSVALQTWSLHGELTVWLGSQSPPKFPVLWCGSTRGYGRHGLRERPQSTKEGQGGLLVGGGDILAKKKNYEERQGR